MNTQKMIVAFVLLISVLLVGCVAPVQAATTAVASQVKNTCVTQGPKSLSLFNMQGAKPGDEMALGEATTCYNADAANPQYWVVENPDKSMPRSVIPTGGLSQEILEKVMDPSLGGFGR